MLRLRYAMRCCIWGRGDDDMNNKPPEKEVTAKVINKDDPKYIQEALANGMTVFLVVITSVTLILSVISYKYLEHTGINNIITIIVMVILNLYGILNMIKMRIKRHRKNKKKS